MGRNERWNGTFQDTLMDKLHAVRIVDTEVRDPASKQSHLCELVGASPPMQRLYHAIVRAARTQSAVLINGESGSGKELVARALHKLSDARGPLIVFDASTADREMIRNDLFGHVKGAFTGATGTRQGAFRSAQGGTLFIDEVGELPLELQPRLLRALENKEITPVGSDRTIRIDVRILAATHRDLSEMVRTGSFRADLFHRLSVLPIHVPPLRAIKQDIPLLVTHLCQELAPSCRVSTAALRTMANHDWPGNVRQLRNVLERAALCAGSVIAPEHIELQDGTPMIETPEPTSPHLSATVSTTSRTLRDIERNVILQTLEKNQENKAATARELGLSISTLKRKLQIYDDSV